LLWNNKNKKQKKHPLLGKLWSYVWRKFVTAVWHWYDIILWPLYFSVTSDFFWHFKCNSSDFKRHIEGSQLIFKHTYFVVLLKKNLLNQSVTAFLPPPPVMCGVPARWQHCFSLCALFFDICERLVHNKSVWNNFIK